MLQHMGRDTLFNYQCTYMQLVNFMMRSCKFIISNCLCIDWSHYFFNLIVGMAIFARPADTRPNSVLMDRIVPGLIKNRVRSGFLQKPGPNLDPAQPGFIYINIYIYIYCYNPNWNASPHTQSLQTLEPPLISLFNSLSSPTLTHSPLMSLAVSLSHALMSHAVSLSHALSLSVSLSLPKKMKTKS